MKESRAEEKWQGIAVSEGIAIGRGLRIQTGARQVYRAHIEEGHITRETERLHSACAEARRELMSIKARAEDALGAGHAYIFEAHLLLLEDSNLLREIEDCIGQEKVNAEWAVRVVSDRLLALYSEIKDDYLRERSSDIEDVTRRILVSLKGECPSEQYLTHDAIIIAEDLLPSTAAELDLTHVIGIASDVGGWTSHTAIIARALGIPAVVGLRDFSRHALTGDEIIINAMDGSVVLHPSGPTVTGYRTSSRKRSTRQQHAHAANGREPARTTDGVEIVLRANIELPAEYEGISQFGACGIGLYRSEFLLTMEGGAPSEEEQLRAYREIADLGREDGAIVRLFDLGFERLTGVQAKVERNPALGLRAVRFCLVHEDMLRTQVRALLRAAATKKLGVVIPMVSDIEDVRRCRGIINEEHNRLLREGNACGRLPLGAMIEVPAAVITAGKLAGEVDFLSVGTNDLVQYLLAVDRSNDQVADWFRSLHPAVLESIWLTLEASRKAFIPAMICGEMAATPAYAVVLVGLGARDLSMAPSSIARVRNTLNRIKMKQAEEIAAECLETSTAAETEELVRDRLATAWPDLFPPESLPNPQRNAKPNLTLNGASSFN